MVTPPEPRDEPATVITIVDNPQVGLWYYPDAKIVHHKIKKFLSGFAFRELLSTGTDYMERYGAVKWLSDDKDMVVLGRDDAIWASEVWSPRVLDIGFKYWAVVAPEEAIGKTQHERFIHVLSTLGIVAKSFPSTEAAFAWLLSCS